MAVGRFLQRILGGNSEINSPASAGEASSPPKLRSSRINDLKGASPGPVIAFGEHSFAVVVGSDEGTPLSWVSAATTPAGGRIIALGHDGLFAQVRQQDSALRSLTEDLLRWLLASHKTGPVVAVGRSAPNAASACKSLAIGKNSPVRTLDIKDVFTTSSQWSAGAGLVITDADVLDDNPSGVAALGAHVQSGGSLWLHSTPWGWEQVTGRDLRTQHGGNQLVQQFGLSFASGTVDAESQPRHRVDAIHGFHARSALLDGRADAADVRLLDALIGSLPIGHAFSDSLGVDIARHDPPQVNPNSPVRASDYQGRIGARLWWDNATMALLHDTGLPLARMAVEGAPAVNVDVPANRWGWISTGRQARPGETITVDRLDVGGSAREATVRVRIGAHSDTLWHTETWNRFPEVSVHRDLKWGACSLANPFGGLVYIEVEDSQTVPMRFQISGGVEAPRFVLGSTSPKDWASLRSLDAPYAEIEGKRFVLTVPTETIRTLTNPEEVCSYWDMVLDTCADLAGLPAERTRPERYVCDVQISHGYLHAGYPVMAHHDVAKTWTSPDRLRAYDWNAAWALFHETGHNHQEDVWTFDGTVEVTCNLFSLYCAERIHGIGEQAHPELARARTRAGAHLRAGAPFEVWKDEPFLALHSYRELIEAYGWDALKAVIASYRSDDPSTSLDSDADQRDAWALRYSATVGRDLSGHFQRWGIPLSDRAIAACRNV